MKKMCRWLSVVLAAGLLLVPTGCREGARGGKGDKTALNIWIQSVNQPEYFLGWFENAFEAAHPEIDLRFLPQVSSALQTNLDVSLTNPDIDMVATWGAEVMPTLVAGNRVMDVSDVMAPLEDSMVDKALLNKIDGKHYGAPIYGFANVIYYNKTVFDQNHWQAPETYEQFKDLCEAVAAVKNKDNKQRYQPLVTGYSYHVIQSLHGQTMTTEELEACTASYSADLPNPFDSQGWKNGFQWLAEMAEDGVFATNISGYTADTATSDFVTQKALMISGPSSDLLALSSSCSFELGVFPFPRSPEKYAQSGEAASQVAGIYTDVLCINSLTRHAEECKKVLSFLYTEQAQQQLLNVFQFPVLRDVGTEAVSPVLKSVFETAFKPVLDIVNGNGMTLYYMSYTSQSGMAAQLEQGFKRITNASRDERPTVITAVLSDIRNMWR